MKKRTAVVYCALFLLALMQTSVSRGETGDRPLVFLGNQNIAPVVYNKDGRPTGLAVDVVRALETRIGRPITVIAMDWTRAQELVTRGDADALIQINRTPEREAIFDFSEPLLESQFAIFTAADRSGITGAESLRGLRVGVERNGIPQKLLQKDPLIQLVVISGFLEGFERVNKGEVDAVVVDYRVGAYILAANHIRNIRVAGEPVASSFSAIAVKKGNGALLAAINRGLGEIRKDGTYSRILSKWEPKEVVFLTREQLARRTWQTVSGISILVCVIAVAWVFTVSRELKKRRLAEKEMHASQARLQQLLGSLPAAVMVYRLDGSVEYANAAAQRILGLSEARLLDSTVADPGWHFVREDGTLLPFEEYPVTRVIAEKRPVHGQVLGVVAAEGAVPRWVYVYAFAETRQAAELHRVVVSFIDVTERVQAESDLKQYKDRLEDEVQQRTADLVLARNAAEAASQAKSAFLANMSHELRTPLNAILGFSDMIGQSPSLPDGMRQSINIVSRSGEHLLALINDVLEVAKIEAGRVELENAAFDLGALVRGVTDMMQVRALEKGLELRIEQSPDFPRYIVGDQARLRQVLINLIGNAVKFTRQGGVIVRLGAGKDRLSEIWIEVEDTGPGMAPELQQQVFEPFVQLGEQGINNGTGLGLTITRQFVKLMGGRIGLESSPGKGSLFRVDLPVKRATESDIAPAPLAEKSEPARLAPGQPSFRILIVEDQRDNQLLLSLLMEAVGYEVKVADNGQRGVELFESWRPHLIWMDRRMPGMDGMEATRRIRGLPGGKEVRIVAVTASAFAEERAEMVEAGMDDFVRKPYRSGEIYACLARQLGVQFVAEGARETADAALAPEQLEILPEALRAELRRALESLKGDEIAVVIRRVGEYDPRLQEVLARFAAEFNYPAILGALRKMIESA